MAVSGERKAELRAESRAKGRRLPEIPDPINPRRKARCRKDLLRFLRTYLKARFPLAFSDDHLRLIALLQTTILTGGQVAMAMPRGSGKTTVCEGACEWALLYGHRRFVFVVAADSKAAVQICANLRADLEGNDLLAEDFPEAVGPVRALEGIARRAEGQAYDDGERTHLIWTREEVRLPCRAAGGGSVIRTAGITGRIRGAKAALADGSQVRPDLVLVDDPQTDESARSVSQVATRKNTLQGTILGLGGPGQRVASLLTCTVIVPGDLAAQVLDRRLHPEWQGTAARLLKSFPDNQRLWDEYAEIYKEAMRTESGPDQANAFYREHRAAMDAGAEAAWRERYEHTHELSAIQHGMNLLVKRGREAFMAEYQNDPTDPLASAELQQITAPAVLRKLNGLERGVVPLDAQTLTAAIDVQGSALYWGLVGWSAGFAGDVLAYGTYPDQGRPYFTLREVEKSFASVHQGASWEASLHAALDRLVSQLCDKEWLRDDGTVARVDRLIIDAGYGESTTTVYQFCRQSRHAAILLPFFGRTVAPGAVSMDEWKRKPGDRVGPGWRMPRPVHRQTRHVLADVNRWKSFVADRLLTPVGDAGSLGIYGRLPMEHRMLADQLAAETRTRVAANGRTSDVWRVKPNRDNHLLDVLAMAAVAASIAGEKIDDAALTRRLRSDPAPAAASAPVENPAPAPAPSSQPPPPRAPPRRPIGGSFMRGGFRIKV